MVVPYSELRPTSGWDLLASLRHPCKFQCVSRLGSVTARQSSNVHQPNFAALNIGRHLYSAGRPSRWAFAHILVVIVIDDSLLLNSEFENAKCIRGKNNKTPSRWIHHYRFMRTNISWCNSEGVSHHEDVKYRWVCESYSFRLISDHRRTERGVILREAMFPPHQL